jgi:type IV pilus assembly protein PilF
MTPKTPTTSVYRMIIIFMIIQLFACTGQSTQQDVRVAEATREIGEAYMRQGDYTAALRELLEAEKLNPEDPFTHNDLGLCYMNKKRMPDAIAHFKKAVALKPSYAPARNNLGTAYLTIEEWDQAIAVFTEITKDVLYATPHFPLANMGWAYYNKKQYQEALKYYKEALKLQPDFVVALRGAGRTYLALNQGRMALRYLEHAAKLAPKIAEIHYDLAEAYLLVGKYNEARISYETVIDLAPPESSLVAKARQRLSSLK